MPPSSLTIRVLILTLFIQSTFSSQNEPLSIRSRSILRSLDDKPKIDYGVDLNVTNFDSVLKETPATYAIVEFFAHWSVCFLVMDFSLSFLCF